MIHTTVQYGTVKYTTVQYTEPEIIPNIILSFEHIDDPIIAAHCIITDARRTPVESITFLPGRVRG